VATRDEQDLIKEFLDRNATGPKVRMGVVGDSMLDEYYQVVVNRISPEFPIALMHSKDSQPVEVVPGGAANVCYQTKNFNVDASLFSFINPKFKSVFKDLNIENSVQDDRVFQPIKRRFYQDNFPISRWDVEQENYGLFPNGIHELQYNLMDNLCEHEFDVVIYSDYNKGVFLENEDSTIRADFLKSANGAKTFVDPKKDLAGWKGCYVLKPNALEASIYSESKSKYWQISDIDDKLEGKSYIVVTMAGEGVMYCHNNVIMKYDGKNKINPNSVIGAGDCFMVFMAMAVARGFDLVDAIKIAFEAGSQYVKAKHNQPLTIESFTCSNS
jgi:D-beta-D-heptose 7-phosphate kinase/D-beta-D-heptose 1-phosphate adenosyltransferase